MVCILRIEGFGELHASMVFALGRIFFLCIGFWPFHLQNRLWVEWVEQVMRNRVCIDAPAIPITNASDICFPSSSYLPTPKFRIIGLSIIHTMVVCHGTSRSYSWAGQWTASPHLGVSFLTLGVPGLHLSSPRQNSITKFEACRNGQVMSGGIELKMMYEQETNITKHGSR